MSTLNSHITFKVESYLDNLKKTDTQIFNFLKNLSKHGQVYLFGGAVRDIVLEGPLRDLDIVIESKYSLDSILKGINQKSVKNIFGGHKISTFSNFKVDIWSIEKTWAFQNFDLQSTFKNLSKTTLLNVNAIAYNLNKNSISEYGFYDYLMSENPELCLNFRHNPDQVLSAVRAIHTKNKFSLEFSSELDLYVEKLFLNKKFKFKDFTSRYLNRYSDEHRHKNDIPDIKYYYSLKEAERSIIEPREYMISPSFAEPQYC